ncbi:MAG: outer membrane beta-barrel protein, partial [Cyclobacteriaceae bacterium]
MKKKIVRRSFRCSLLVLLALLSPGLKSPVFGQSGAIEIIGKIIDNDSKAALEYATVSLYQLPDSVLLTGSITNEQGSFKISASPGTYFLRAEYLAYHAFDTNPIHITANEKVKEIGVIGLKPDVSTLDELVVEGAKEYMTMRLDKKVFNVQEDLASAGGTAADILANIPAINVGADGSITLRGSSQVRILIDGKPSGIITMNGAEGLRQLQGHLVESIEVITNPSARYEAEGLAGVINIVLKKDQKSGLNGSFDFTAGDPANFGTAFNLNYRHEKFNFFVNYGIFYRHGPSIRRIYQEVYLPDTVLISEQNADRLMKGMFNNIRFGADYFFNDQTILTTSFTYLHSKAKRYSDIDYFDYINTRDNLTSTTFRTQDEDEVEPSLEFSLNFKKDFGQEGHTLNANLTVIDNWEDSKQIFTEQIRFPNQDTINILQRSDNYETEKQLLIQADYEKPFGSKGKFEAGTRNAFRRLTNDFLVEQEEESGWEVVLDLSNDFLYNENILAAYAIVGNETGQFSYQ